MAKYHVTHACGHETEYNLFGPYESRRQRISSLESRLCPECWEAKRNEENAKANAAAAAKAAEAGLPALEGTPKQVAWAESIRVKAITYLEERFATITPERQAQIAPLLAKLKAQDKAAWWIDNRNLLPVDMLRAISKGGI